MTADSNEPNDEPRRPPLWRTIVKVALMAIVVTIALLHASQAPIVLYQAF